MTDLRERLIAVLEKAGNEHAWDDVDYVWPLIEAELQKRDQQLATLRATVGTFIETMFDGAEGDDCPIWSYAVDLDNLLKAHRSQP